MEFRITTLVENTVPKGRGFLGEHGLSFFIEAGDRNVLFDTGQGAALTRNAECLGIDLASVDTVVLSHGHYDHTGGIGALLSVNRRFTLYAHPDVFAEKVAVRDGQARGIGFSMTRKALESAGIRVVLDTCSMEIVPGVATTGEVPMHTSYESIDPALFMRREGTRVPDPLKDDLSLILRGRDKTGVLLGCAHRGVVNILTHVRTLTGKKRIDVIAGGMHLMGAPEAVLKRIIEDVEAFSPMLLAPGHCTGFPAVWALWTAFQKRFQLNQVGSVIQI